MIPSKSIENGSICILENRILKKLKSSFAEEISLTIAQITNKLKEDINSIINYVITII